MIYDAIIFDLDGTLIDSMQLWRRVDEEFLTRRGICVPADLFDAIPGGNSFIQTAQYFIDRFGLSESVEEIMAEWTQMVYDHYSSDIFLKPGAGELVKELAAVGVPIGLATSNSYELAQVVLSANGVWDSFQSVATGDMDLRGKPYPDIFLKCAAQLGIPAQNCLAVEDTLSGVMAASCAGMRVYAIFDEDSEAFWPQIQKLAHRSFADYMTLSPALKSELGLQIEE